MHTLLCSNSRTLNCCSKSLLTKVGSNVEEQSGGRVGHDGLAPRPHTDRTASWDIGFHRDSFPSSKWLTSTCSEG